MLLKLTALLLGLVFCWLMVSCQTLPRKKASSRFEPTVQVQKKSDPMYVKRESLSIKPRFEGSTTGSIWADTLSPKQLIAEAKPQRSGEMITINIPESMKFVSNNAPAKSASKDQKPAPGLQSGASTLLSSTEFENLSQFKMQILAMEPQGDAFVKGTKSFSGPEGEMRTLTLLAKLPSQAINSYEVSAQALSEISLVETLGNQSTEYIASGWDTTVSRKLSGWLPDLEAQAEVLEGQKKELETVKSGIMEQQKSIVQEKERILAERKRNNEKMAQMEAAYQKSQSNEPSGPQSAPMEPNSGAPGSNPPLTSESPAAGGPPKK